MLTELVSVRSPRLRAVRGDAEGMRGHAAAEFCARGVVPTVRAYDPRAGFFRALESLILGHETTLRRNTWRVPACDVERRLWATARADRRREHLAESARLAEQRRADPRRGG